MDQVEKLNGNMNSNEIEFLCEICNQITEESFNGECIIEKDNEIIYTEVAQEFFNRRYDEIETLYINLIKNDMDTR